MTLFPSCGSSFFSLLGTCRDSTMSDDDKGRKAMNESMESHEYWPVWCKQLRIWKQPKCKCGLKGTRVCERRLTCLLLLTVNPYFVAIPGILLFCGSCVLKLTKASCGTAMFFLLFFFLFCFLWMRSRFNLLTLIVE
jgi:hypothetical protein